jgi:hypothetical protein
LAKGNRLRKKKKDGEYYFTLVNHRKKQCIAICLPYEIKLSNALEIFGCVYG